MENYTKPMFEVEWDKLDRGFIGKEYQRGTNSQLPPTININTYPRDFFINDSYKPVKLGTSILIEDVKEHIKPQYYQLSKILGITHIGFVLEEAHYLDRVIKPDSIIAKMIERGVLSDIRRYMYSERYSYLQYTQIFDDKKRKYSNLYDIFDIHESEIPKIMKEDVFDKIYEIINSEKRDRIPLGIYYIVFCSEEHGIYGNIIDPKTLYPLDMGFIMSNVMNSTMISNQFASLQLTISRLEDKIRNLERSKPKKKLPLSTRKFSYFGTTNKKKTRKNRALSDRDIVYI